MSSHRVRGSLQGIYLIPSTIDHRPGRPLVDHWSTTGRPLVDQFDPNKELYTIDHRPSTRWYIIPYLDQTTGRGRPMVYNSLFGSNYWSTSGRPVVNQWSTSLYREYTIDHRPSTWSTTGRPLVDHWSTTGRPV